MEHNQNSYALYQMALFPMTLMTPNYPKPPNLQYFVWPVIS